MVNTPAGWGHGVKGDKMEGEGERLGGLKRDYTEIKALVRDISSMFIDWQFNHTRGGGRWWGGGWVGVYGDPSRYRT